MSKIKTIVFGTESAFALNVSPRLDDTPFDSSNISRVVATFGEIDIDSAINPDLITWNGTGRFRFKLVDQLPVDLYDLHLKVYTPISESPFSVFHREFEFMNFQLRVVE